MGFFKFIVVPSFNFASSPSRAICSRAAYACVGLLALLGAASAQGNPEIGEFFARINRAIVSLAGQSEARAYATCADLVNSMLDIDTMSRGASGPAWKLMSAQQRSVYRETLGRRAARDCVDQNKDNNGELVALLGVRDGENGDRLLATRVEHQGQASHTIIWRLRTEQRRGLQAVDLLVDGRSTVLSLGDEATAILNRSDGDIDAVIGSLER